MSDLLRHPVEIIRRLRGLPFGDSVTGAGDSVPSGHMAWKLKPEMRMVQLGTSSGDLCLAVPVSDVALVKDAVDGTEPSA
jgi:hypothetical protein